MLSFFFLRVLSFILACSQDTCGSHQTYFYPSNLNLFLTAYPSASHHEWSCSGLEFHCLPVLCDLWYHCLPQSRQSLQGLMKSCPVQVQSSFQPRNCPPLRAACSILAPCPRDPATLAAQNSGLLLSERTTLPRLHRPPHSKQVPQDSGRGSHVLNPHVSLLSKVTVL